MKTRNQHIIIMPPTEPKPGILILKRNDMSCPKILKTAFRASIKSPRQPIFYELIDTKSKDKTEHPDDRAKAESL